MGVMAPREEEATVFGGMLQHGIGWASQEKVKELNKDIDKWNKQHCPAQQKKKKIKKNYRLIIE
jgi:hypothetical protein